MLLMLHEGNSYSRVAQKVGCALSSVTYLKPEDILRDPIILEFPGLEEKPEYTETGLEQAIINHL